jgi:hypothetical protein
VVTSDANHLIKQFASLQGRLVRTFLDRYQPEDRERFRDVPNGTLAEAGTTWAHQRHGAGILFTSSESVRVNAHVAMTEYPEGVDGGRLFEYLESLGIASVNFEGRRYATTKPEMDRLMEHMRRSGLLRPVISSGSFPHRIFELTQEPLVS